MSKIVIASRVEKVNFKQILKLNICVDDKVIKISAGMCTFHTVLGKVSSFKPYLPFGLVGGAFSSG